MTDPILLIGTDPRGVCTMTMNRPEVRNAFNADLIAEITRAVTAASADPSVRVIVLTGAGKAFSAGADLNMMQEVAGFSEAENIAEAERLADMLMAIHNARQPTIARVNGAAMGGGVGLVSACNIAIGSDAALFALSEVRLGLIPAAISPFVIKAIGTRQAERWFLTGERCNADTAKDIGLLHQVGTSETLDQVVEDMVDQLLLGSPHAQSEAKSLIHAVHGTAIGTPLMRDVAQRIARARASADGQEGLSAFLEKRQPAWVNTSDV